MASFHAASAVASAGLLVLDKLHACSHSLSTLQATVWKLQKVPCPTDLLVDLITAWQSELPTVLLCGKEIAEGMCYRRCRSMWVIFEADFHTLSYSVT